MSWPLLAQQYAAMLEPVAVGSLQVKNKLAGADVLSQLMPMAPLVQETAAEGEHASYVWPAVQQ
jgi:hypothetical protein